MLSTPLAAPPNLQRHRRSPGGVESNHRHARLSYTSFQFFSLRGEPLSRQLVSLLDKLVRPRGWMLPVAGSLRHAHHPVVPDNVRAEPVARPDTDAPRFFRFNHDVRHKRLHAGNGGGWGGRGIISVAKVLLTR